MRMRAPDEGAPWTAGQFMPAADRIGMTAELDLLAIELALQRLQHNSEAIAVNISPISLQSFEFREGLQRLLSSAPTSACRLWMEISEAGLDQEGSPGLARMSSILGVGVAWASSTSTAGSSRRSRGCTCAATSIT